MRIAVIITGRLIDADSQFEAFKNNIFCKDLFPENEIDVFISYPKDESDETVERIRELYKPKILIKSDENHFDPGDIMIIYNDDWMCNRKTAMCMFYSKYFINKAFKNYVETTNTNYDLVVSTRFELEFKTPICPYLMKNRADNDLISIPWQWCWMGGLNDQIAFGNYKNMTEYLDLYSYLYIYFCEGLLLHAETLLSYHFKKRGLKVMKFDYDYILKRKQFWI